jgi:hypothetical protein
MEQLPLEMYPSTKVMLLHLYIYVSFLKTYRLKHTNYNFSPFVLHGCEIWSLTLSGEHRLRVFAQQ